MLASSHSHLSLLLPRRARGRAQPRMPFALALLMCSISPATSCTRVALIEQTSRATCSPGKSYGCEGNGSMYTIHCRGRFRCAASMPIIRCGYPPGRKRYSCFCNGTSPTATSPISAMEKARSRVCSTNSTQPADKSFQSPEASPCHCPHPLSEYGRHARAGGLWLRRLAMCVVLLCPTAGAPLRSVRPLVLPIACRLAASRARAAARAYAEGQHAPSFYREPLQPVH